LVLEDAFRLRYHVENDPVGAPGVFAEAAPVTQNGAPVQRYSSYAADMNGDGLTDHLEYTPEGTWRKLIASPSS
jgi:hypothetical protein